jgi:hypothetical protein
MAAECLVTKQTDSVYVNGAVLQISAPCHTKGGQHYMQLPSPDGSPAQSFAYTELLMRSSSCYEVQTSAEQRRSTAQSSCFRTCRQVTQSSGFRTQPCD